MGFFGRKRQEPQRLEQPKPEAPFGENIATPDSRTVPAPFHGVWVRDISDCGAEKSKTRKVISGDRIIDGDNAQRVVAVRFIEADKIAVVTLPAETEEKAYSMFYFGLSEDGDSLVDLESTDWVLHRCPTDAR